MTFINKKSRLFLDRGDIKPERRRSEARLKTYPSAVDIRAWCSIVEDRRQHILELITKGTEKCVGKLVPLEAMIRALLGNEQLDVEDLKKCMYQLWKFIENLQMTDEDKTKLLLLKRNMNRICLEASKELNMEKLEIGDVKTSAALISSEAEYVEKVKAPECPAKARHEKEKAEVEALTNIPVRTLDKYGSYRVKSTGPAKIITKIKGLRPGFQVSTGNIATRAIIRNAYPENKHNIDGSSKSEHPRKEAIEKGNNFAKEIQILQDQLAERSAVCDEQQASIDKLKNERDKLKNRIKDCLEELETLKNLHSIGSPVVPLSCKEEIDALEQEIQVMRNGHLSPEQEAEVIKKEVEVLKKYCLKLKSIEDENEQLRTERDALINQVGNKDSSQNVQQWEKEKMNDLTKERDSLANKVDKLEKELLQYRDTPKDLDIYKDRSGMLDNALAERDELVKKLEKMKDLEKELNEQRQKVNRYDQLEQNQKYSSKHDINSDIELRKTKSKCCCLERELQNVRLERDAMSKRIDCMKMELETLKSKAKEVEMLKLERDRLQIKLNENSHVQLHNENLILKCKCLESAANERDAYKQKYEEILEMECQCEMMRSQVEASRCIARERDALVKQVDDLESCIHVQEDEIKRLVVQIENLKKNKDDKQIRMKGALVNMRAEVDKKDRLIAASEEKLLTLQAQLKSSIQGVSCETTCYKTRIEELERELCQAQNRIARQQAQLKERETCLKGAKKITKNEYDSVSIMKKELDAANAENKKLQEIANKMVLLTGDEHVQKMLKQSECAVRRVVEELGKQYREWDHMRHRHQKGKLSKKGCPCKINRLETEGLSETESSEKLKEELEDIQREKEKLENLVKQIQNDKFADGPQNEIVSLRLDNAKLQEQLRKEMNMRRSLEQKLNKFV